jgi:low affinity Fe/Cu permease
MEWFRHHLTTLGAHVAHPVTLLIVVVYAAAWYHVSPSTFEWHAIATLATWMMTLVIQRSAHRDTQAIHAKLDELLRSHPEARNELAQLDDEEPEDIEAFRKKDALRRD